MNKRNLFMALLLLSFFATASFFVYDNHSLNNDFGVKVNYEKEWKKVDSLIAKGLPKSALEIVNKIYLQAKLHKDAAQHVKTIIYRTKLKTDFEEDFLVKSIIDINAEINTSYFPVTPVLHSILAEMYMKYYQNNIYNILNRTETVDFKQDDIKTLDVKKIIEKVIFHYIQSLENSKELQNINTDLFDPIIIKDSTTRKFRPTLYDFLAHRAIDFFMSGKAEIIKPAYSFEINNNDYFALPDVFSKLYVNTLDTFSFRFYALNLLKDLEKFHINDKDPGALIDVTLKRLNFVRKNSVTDEKDSLYLKTLIELNERYNYSEHSTNISYAIANEYLRLGRLYNPLQSAEHKYDIKTAHKICKDAVEKFPNSDGAANCRVLIESMEQKSISVLNEYVEVPDKVFRALISYKNIEDVYFRIIKIDPDKNLKLTEKYYDKELIKQYLKFSPVKEWSIKLPEDDDMQSHSVEIAMPELPLGFYVILAGSTADFSTVNLPVAYGNIWISNISYISRANEDYSYDIYVLDRTTGKAIENATIETYYREYNYSSRSYDTKKWKTFTSDNKGYVFIPAMSDSKYSRYFYADFRKGKDYLATQNYFYQYRYDEQQKKYNKTFFFTDRAIYRPGQTIYFKGILLEKEGENYNIRPNAKTRVVFYDANYQEVSSTELISNEYGSVSGTFTAPQGGLNGQMYITDTYGYKYFNVEEYKRPKFEVNFEPIKGSYKLDEELTIKGKAVAYAGSNIDGATVKYRVVRTARFPYWGWWWRMPLPSSPSMEITSGTTITDVKGEFEVKFKAIADKNVSKKYSPVFNYSVTADVTDINGETRSSNSNISVGYKALILNVQMPENIEKSEKNIFKINALNLNGEKEPTSGTINIYKLKQPNKVFRQRLWTRPDKYLLSKGEYYQLFPNDLYADEDDKSKWEKAEKMLTLSFDTHKDSVFDATRFKNWKEGQYILEITAKDAFGETVENKNYFSLYSKKANTIPEITTCWFTAVNTKGEPGDKASFIVGTKEKDVSVLYEIENKNKIIYKELFKLNDEQKFIEIPITEEHRGNFAVHITFVKNGRSYSNSAIVTVPYTNKELDIKFETFRNKLLPGQAEEWKIRIKGEKGEKVAAEMLAAMYDASLDAFAPNYWDFNILNYYYNRRSWQTNETFTSQTSSSVYNYKNKYVGVYYKYDFLNWFGMYYFNQYRYSYYDGDYKYDLIDATTMQNGGVISRASSGKAMNAVTSTGEFAEAELAKEEMSVDGDASASADKKNAEIPSGLPQNTQSKDFTDVQIRSNFNETAFFLPQLETDEKGDIIIKFTVPEALTKWKIMGFAHTKDLKYGMIQKELITQKDLMVIPNPPRFFREFDKISFSAKISNVSDKDLEGEARLEFFDATTMKPIDAEVKNINTNKSFSVTKGQSTSLNWDIFIPDRIGAITYRIVAKAGNFSDGEEMAIPVLTNRMLVTESLPLPINGKQSKNFTFVKLIESEKSSTLKNHKLTLEFTSNPAWYAVQALPYLMEYPYECSEQVFSRYYANSIASYIANSSPKIKAVFDSWKNFTPDALLSNLEKNQELKALMLEETPWVLNAKSESERKKRISLLFDLTRMANELDRAERLLIKKQSSNGGWPWFDGMPESRYITQHIITGFGHLSHLGIKDIKENKKVWNMIEKGVKYLDTRIKEDYENIKKYYPKTIDENHLSYDNIQYLYARSYFLNDIRINRVNQEAYDYFKKQSQKYWIDNNIYMQGMISLALHRDGDSKTADEIIRSLKEKALHSEEMGMYWRDLAAGYYWYQAPIETQALLIEAFDEVAKDKIAVEEMKIWLLKQKQTQDWKTTKATTEACYALLLRGTDVLASNELVQVSLGNTTIDPAKLEGVKAEAGTGYFKTSWSGSDIKPEMGNVKVTKNDDGVAWGALYWQYFEQLDKITPAETPLKLDKKLFRKFNTETGPKIEPINEKTNLKIGDKITVRIELRVDRDMEYVHMKDMRASGFEPVNVFSGYKYQGGLGYYESTRDAATNFFFANLLKGTYVFEYPMVVSHKGDFSNGITTIQCMYAPEFSSHSEGIRVKVE